MISIYIYCIEVDSGLKVAFNAFICVVLISCQPLVKLMIYSYSASEFSKSMHTHTHLFSRPTTWPYSLLPYSSFPFDYPFKTSLPSPPQSPPTTNNPRPKMVGRLLFVVVVVVLVVVVVVVVTNTKYPSGVRRILENALVSLKDGYYIIYQ